jgi:putative glycosyl hydrolase-like family 15 (GHL15) protein/Big-like domain-containing protein
MRFTALLPVSYCACVPASASGERNKTFRNASTTAGRKLVKVALRAFTFTLFLAAALPCAAQSDTTPPTVAIVSPPSGATLCGTVPIIASASDNVGVVGVQFKYNGINVGAEDTSAPYAVPAYTTAVANGSYALTAVARDAAGNVTTSAPVTVTVANPTSPSGSCKFIPSFLVYYAAGPALVLDDAPKLAKFDGIDIDRFRYTRISPSADTWTTIKSYNPQVQIFLYEVGAEDSNYHDGLAPAYVNDVARYDLSWGHPMGSLNGNHPELFLLDSAGKRIYYTAASNVAANQYWYLMDIGSAVYQTYWLMAVKADIVDQPWIADGVFADDCTAINVIDFGAYSSVPTKYSNDVDWSGAMNSFAGAITAGLHGYGQKLWCNRGDTLFPGGSTAWRNLDASATPPDVLLEEGAFAVMWGAGDVQFYQESDWKRQVDTMAAIRNSSVAMISHTKLLEGQAGTDNWGQPVTFWQTLWYSLGSFLLTKNDQLNNAYFMFNGGSGYDKIWWYDEYDMIYLGKSVGPYAATPMGTSNGPVNVYWREFEKGYVYVNPTPNNVASVTLPQACQATPNPCRQVTHDNLLSPPSGLPAVTAIPLSGHSAAIILKM